MRENTNRILHGIAAAVALTWNSGTWAGGPSTNGVAARAQSMQSAFVAVADDPSAVYYNPAGLTQITSSHISANGIVVLPDVEFESAGGSAESRKAGVGGSLFGVKPVSETVSLGLGIYSPYARTTQYTAGVATGGASQSSDILRLDLSPVAAIEIGKLSIGGGPIFSFTDFSSNVLDFSEGGSGFSAGVHVGALYSIAEDIKLGAAFRSDSTAKLKGRGVLSGLPSSAFAADFNYPSVLVLGASFRPEPQLLISTQLDWEMWSGISSFNRNYDNALYDFLGSSVLNSTDSFVARLGFEYSIDDEDKVRGGYSYATAAVPAKNIIPAFPDFDIHSISLGYGRTFGSVSTDLCVEFQYMPERTGGAAPFVGDYENMVATVL